MKPLTSIHHKIRHLPLLILLVICNISFNGCSGSNESSLNESSISGPGNKLLMPAPNLPKPAIFIYGPESFVGNQCKISLLRTEKIDLPAITILLKSNNKASFVFIKKNGEACGEIAKPLEVTDYTKDRYQDDMTQPIKLRLDKDNGEKEATITITILGNNNEVLAGKDIYWRKEGTSIFFQPDAFRSTDQEEVKVTITNTGNKPTDLSKLIINCKSTDEQVFIIGNTSSETSNINLATATGVKDLDSHLSTQMSIRLLNPLEDQAVGLEVTLSEVTSSKEKKDNTSPVIAKVPLLFYPHQIPQIKKEIYQQIGENGEKLDGFLQNSSSYELKYLTESLAKLEEGIKKFRGLSDKLANIAQNNPNFESLISNLRYDCERYIKRWELAIQRIEAVIQVEKMTERSQMLQQELETIPGIMQKKFRPLASESNIQNITDALIAPYHKDLALEEQSINGLLKRAQQIRQELASIQHLSNQQNKGASNSNLAPIDEQLKMIEAKSQTSLEDGFSLFKSILLQQQNATLDQLEWKEKEQNEQMDARYDQLKLQATVLDQWSKYIRTQNQKNINEHALYIEESYVWVANKMLKLARAYHAKKYSGNVLKCTNVVNSTIIPESLLLPKITELDKMKELANIIIDAAIKINQILEPTRKHFPFIQQLDWEPGKFHIKEHISEKLSKNLEAEGTEK